MALKTALNLGNETFLYNGVQYGPGWANFDDTQDEVVDAVRSAYERVFNKEPDEKNLAGTTGVSATGEEEEEEEDPDTYKGWMELRRDDLRKRAEELGISGSASMNKPQLVELIMEELGQEFDTEGSEEDADEDHG